MRKLFISFAIFLNLVFSSVTVALAEECDIDDNDTTVDSVDELIEQAEQAAAELSRHPQWLALLHYKDEVWTPSFISQVDDDAFFLAAEGRTDPLAELRADIPAMLQPSGSGHAQCRFPARWHWLKQQLAIDDSHDVPCPRFERWQQSIPSDSLSLIFPSMYLNNPGSSFGHTFIRFDNNGSILLSQALNYAASYRPSDSLPKYIYNGLFGGYRGVFTMKHYYERVQEYTNLENRDIWEYRLDYTQEEIQQLIRHVWEVTEINFDYYFFSENCSYRLLALLDVLREDSRLTSKDKFPLYAIPVDTVRVLDEAGVITERHYRPSLASKLRDSLSMMAAETRSATIRLVDGETDIDAIETEFDAVDQATIYASAFDLLQFRGQEKSDAAQRILYARNDIELPAYTSKQAAQPPVITPEHGHGSARFDISAGRFDDSDVAMLRLKPAFHDLLDSPDGYIAGAKIDIFNTAIRKQQHESVQLDELVFINITSLPPVSDWQSPVSWMLDVRLQRQSAGFLNTTDSFISQQTQGGAGMSVDIGATGTNRFFALAIARLDIAEELHKGYGLQGGAQLGVLHYGAFGQAKLQLQILRDMAGQESEIDSLQFGYQYNLASDLAVRFEFERSLFAVGDESEWLLGVNVYF